MTSLCSKRRDSDDEDESVNRIQFRFLGRGPNAIVRPGCVLLAPSNEFHTFYRRSAIFIYGMGQNDDDQIAQTLGEEPDFLIRGLILDNPTPFTLAEMMNHNPSVTANQLGNNFLFRGGDKGGDGVILLHNQELSPEEDTSSSYEMIGTSGIYQGGWSAALEACDKDESVTERYKAFFNYCEFTEKELEDMLDSRGDDGDAWMSIEVSPDIVLNQDWDRGDAWKVLRKAVRLQEEEAARSGGQPEQEDFS